MVESLFRIPAFSYTRHASSFGGKHVGVCVCDGAPVIAHYRGHLCVFF